MSKDIKTKPNKKYYKILTVLFFLTSLFFASLYIYSSSHHKKNPYPLIDISRNFIPQEDFIVDIQDSRVAIRELIKREELENQVSIYIEVLNTGANISINPEKKIFPASLTKLPLSIAVVKKIEDGIWDWDTKLTIQEKDLDKNSGYLYQHGAGTEITVEELLNDLLIKSDNTAYKILLNNIEPEYFIGMVSSLGLEDLFQDDGKMSAKEYARFFRSLYTSSYLKRENSQKILQKLTQSKFDSYLQSGIPNDVPFAHKIGENYIFNSYSDAGIVYFKNRPYYIGVMYETKDGAEDKQKVEGFMRDVSRIVYEDISSK